MSNLEGIYLLIIYFFHGFRLTRGCFFLCSSLFEPAFLGCPHDMRDAQKHHPPHPEGA